jgi:hypothetical protein
MSWGQSRPPAPCPAPNEPERRTEPRREYVLSEPLASGRALHEPAAPWLPKEPETGPARHAPAPVHTNPKPLVGTTAADGALAAAAALLQSMGTRA